VYSLPLAEQPPNSLDTKGVAWPNIGGKAPETVVTPLFTDGDQSALGPPISDGFIPTDCDFLPEASACPRPQDHRPQPLDSRPPAGHSTNSRDTPGEACLNIGGQAPEPPVAPLSTAAGHSVIVSDATDGIM